MAVPVNRTGAGSLWLPESHLGREVPRACPALEGLLVPEKSFLLGSSSLRIDAMNELEGALGSTGISCLVLSRVQQRDFQGQSPVSHTIYY